MAKNIHTTIKEGIASVMHQGEELDLELPSWMSGLSDVLQDKDGFIAKLEEEDLTLAFLHAGLKECMVGFRAHCRPKEGVSISTITDEHSMLYRPEVQDVPKAKKPISKKEAIAALRAGGMSDEEIMELLTQ